MELDDAIKERSSVRKFSTKKPDWRDVIECIDACRYAPMAGNNFTLKFIVIDDKEKIQKIAEACQQDFVSQVHYIVVACSQPSRTLNAYGKRGETFVRQQAGSAIQNFLLKITEKNLATCWVGYFVEEQIKRILKIPENVQVEAVFPIGYKSQELKGKAKRAKIDLDNILYFNVYKNKKMRVPRKID